MILWLCAHWWTSGIIGLNKLVLVSRSGRDIVLNDHFLRLSAGVNWFHSSRIYSIALIFSHPVSCVIFWLLSGSCIYRLVF